MHQNSHSRPRRVGQGDDAGFTLLEVLVAMAVLAIATLTLTGMRTTSIIDAAEARNARIAREIATRVLSEVEAGVLRAYDMRGVRHEVEDLPYFTWRIVIGEGEIQEAETELTEMAASESGRDEDQRLNDRQQWLNRRREVNRARELNKPIDDLETQELEVDESPDEDTIEEVAIFVYWPTMKPKTDNEDEEGIFRLRGQVTTLALSGLTEEQAEARGDGESTSSESGGLK